jgi:hypothetical protein
VKRLLKTGRVWVSPVILAGAFACLPVNAIADSHTIIGHALEPGTDHASSTPGAFSLLADSPASALDFDLAGSDHQKLELQLANPLTLSMGSNARLLDNGSDVLGLDATLNVPLTDRFNLVANTRQQVGQSRFLSLGSIQCLNGTLRADSYTASGCRFIHGSTEQQDFSLGASLDFGIGSASMNWFTRDASASQNTTAVSGAMVPGISSNSMLSPNLVNPLISTQGTDPLNYLNSETSGVNLNFAVGITTDTRGDVQLGLAFARIFEADYRGLYASANESLAWTVTEPFNSARMSLEWNLGAFSTGIEGYYRDQVDFLSRNSIDSLATFDVHFTWRTPWNANLSVGATNVLNSGADNAAKTDPQPIDPLESVYGRIPYVRYKQDL